MALTHTKAGMFYLIGQSMSIMAASWKWPVGIRGKQPVLCEE